MQIIASNDSSTQVVTATSTPTRVALYGAAKPIRVRVWNRSNSALKVFISGDGSVVETDLEQAKNGQYNLLQADQAIDEHFIGPVYVYIQGSGLASIALGEPFVKTTTTPRLTPIGAGYKNILNLLVDPDRANLKLCLTPGIGNCQQDTGFTSSSYADGNVVGYARNLVAQESDSPNGFSQSTAGAKPLLKLSASGINSKPGWKNDANGDGLDATPTALYTAINGQVGYTLHFVVKGTNTATGLGVVLGNTSARYISLETDSTTQVLRVRHTTGTSGAPNEAVFTTNSGASGNGLDIYGNGPEQVVHYTIVFTPTGSSLGTISCYRNGFLIGSLAGMNEPAWSGVLRIGDLNGAGGFFYQGTQGMIRWYAGVQSAANRQAIANAMMQFYSLPSDASGTFAPTLCVVGNSLVSGYQLMAGSANTVSGCADFGSWLRYMLGANINYFNYGVPAQTLTQQIANDPKKIAHLAMPSKSAKVVFVWEGTNELSANIASATIVNDVLTLYQSWITLFAGYGFDVYVLPIIPRRGTSDDTTFEAKRLLINAGLYSNIATWGGKAVVPLDSDAAFDASLDATNTTYYQGDTIHLNTYGQMLVAWWCLWCLIAQDEAAA